MTGCKNCGHRFEGKYCNLCGQKADTHRIDLHYALHEVPHAIFHFESGIFYTIRELLLRPGITINAFLEGRRVRLFKPILYLLVMTSVSAILKTWYNLIKVAKHMPTETPVDANRPIDLVEHFVAGHPGLSLLILVPFVSLVTRWFFKKTGYNFWENAIINTYLIGTMNLFFIVLVVLRLIFYKYELPAIIRMTPAVLMYVYVVTGYYQLYRQATRRWWTVVKAILAPAFAFISAVFIVGIISGLAGVIK